MLARLFLTLAWTMSLGGCAGSVANRAFDASSMVRLGTDAWIDSEATDEERRALAHALDNTERTLAARLPDLDADPPSAYFCKSERCQVYFAGPARRSWTLKPHDHVPGAAFVAGDRPTIIIVRTDARAAAHLLHERVHVALGFGRRALAGKPFGLLPLWFHEGLATSIADEPECVGRPQNGIDDLRRLAKNASWAAYTMPRENRTPTYCQARREVDAWLARHGEHALATLLDSVRQGTPFDVAYGPLLTQQ
jgi:hypothetical protein